MTELNEMNDELVKTEKTTYKFPFPLNDKRLSREEFDAEYEDWIEKVLKGEIPNGTIK